MNAAEPSQKPRNGNDHNKKLLAQLAVGALVVAGLVTFLRCVAPPAVGPEASGSTAPGLTSGLRPPGLNSNALPRSDPFATEVAIERPTDPQDGWLRVAELTDAQASAKAWGRYEPHNEFRIQTQNVCRFELDVFDLPVSRENRFIFHIDGQDMVVYPKGQGVLRFSRSPLGVWELDR